MAGWIEHLRKLILKEGIEMNIAVTTQGDRVFEHFGTCRKFTIFEVEMERVISFKETDTEGEGHGSLVSMMKKENINVLICGGIGGSAKNALRVMGIEIVAGVQGGVKEAVKRYLSGEVIGIPNFVCNHNHGGNHECTYLKNMCVENSIRK